MLDINIIMESNSLTNSCIPHKMKNMNLNMNRSHLFQRGVPRNIVKTSLYHHRVEGLSYLGLQIWFFLKCQEWKNISPCRYQIWKPDKRAKIWLTLMEYRANRIKIKIQFWTRELDLQSLMRNLRQMNKPSNPLGSRALLILDHPSESRPHQIRSIFSNWYLMLLLKTLTYWPNPWMRASI